MARAGGGGGRTRPVGFAAVAWALVVAVLLPACAGGGGAAGRGADEASGIPGLDEADRMAGRLVDRLLASPLVAGAGGARLPVGMAEVVNLTDDDWTYPQAILGMLRTRLLGSGRFVCYEIDPDAKGSGPARGGIPQGVRYLIIPTLSNMMVRGKGADYSSYTLDLEVVEVEDGAIRWSGRETFRTKSTRGR